MAEREEELVRSNCIKVRTITPAETKRFSRGFYQVEEDCLYAPLYPSGNFYSYVDSTNATGAPSGTAETAAAVGINLDIDREGRLLFIHVKTPRRMWNIDPNLKLPAVLETADLRFVSFRADNVRSNICASPNASVVMISFAAHHAARHFRIADSMIAGIGPGDCLCSLWLLDCIADRGAREMALWRSRQKAEANDSIQSSPFTRIEIE